MCLLPALQRRLTKGRNRRASLIWRKRHYAATVEQVFAGMVQAAATYKIGTVSKDGCLVQFSTTRPASNREESAAVLSGMRNGVPDRLITPMNWTLTCRQLSDGKVTVSVKATVEIGYSTVDASQDPTRTLGPVMDFMWRTTKALWYELDARVPVHPPDTEKK